MIFWEGMVCSSVNIQYQSTEIGLFPSMDEIELKQSIRYFFSKHLRHFPMDMFVNIFSGNVAKIYCAATTNKIILNKLNTH